MAPAILGAVHLARRWSGTLPSCGRARARRGSQSTPFIFAPPVDRGAPAPPPLQAGAPASGPTPPLQLGAPVPSEGTHIQGGRPAPTAAAAVVPGARAPAATSHIEPAVLIAASAPVAPGGIFAPVPLAPAAQAPALHAELATPTVPVGVGAPPALTAGPPGAPASASIHVQAAGPGHAATGLIRPGAPVPFAPVPPGMPASAAEQPPQVGVPGFAAAAVGAASAPFQSGVSAPLPIPSSASLQPYTADQDVELARHLLDNGFIPTRWQPPPQSLDAFSSASTSLLDLDDLPATGALQNPQDFLGDDWLYDVALLCPPGDSFGTGAPGL
ncbi:hypothetical protein AURDEDRAFT_177389 [Auricularia subglabra TFB-10046 SS5]|uniref:Uncharacterized protein n=1 Tax=Auricularia subglabra (strain TFB-10046 / SS5) TaxID=717982 RepID=J0CTA8_AURST|nr:hypothetical protein AURDEDRAFT_177389 [Auricularia subglabra TFB-10046 SS5]